jgi:hypothetical protein
MASKSRSKTPASPTAAKRGAAKTSAAKTSSSKTSSSKTSPSKTSPRQTAKPAAKPSARKMLASTGRAAPAPKRRRQQVAISHLREEDFKTDGLRAYAAYRDLGIADATHGLARAHVIRLLPPCNPHEVSKLHTHAVEFQMVYVLKGWVKSYLEGVGETLMKQGSSWTQPPKIKHMILDYSDDVELLEVILPADFKTKELTA